MRTIIIGMTLCFGLAAASCGDDDDDEEALHTVDMNGVMHGEGLHDPMNSCTSCHGADLRGGDDEEPSCFSCHGQQW